MATLAEYNFNDKDLIGKWEYRQLVNENFKAVSEIEFRADGVLSEKKVLLMSGQ